MRVLRNVFRVGTAAGLLLVWNGLFAQPSAAETNITADPTSIEIAGEPGQDVGEVFSLLSPTASAIAAPVVVVPGADPMALADEAVVISPDRATLVPGLPQVFRVTVTLPDEPGDYSASITIRIVPDPDRPSPPPASDPVSIDVTASVRETATPSPSPELAPVGGVNATRVACGDREGFDCRFAGMLLPSVELSTAVSVVVQNPGTIAAQPEKAAILAIGERTGSRLTTAEMPLGSPPQIEPGDLDTLTFGVPLAPQPDHYVGQVAVALGGVPKPITAGVDLTFRQGPLTPAALLSIGLAAGAALRFMRFKWKPTGDAFARLLGSERRADQISLADDERAVVSARLEQARKDLKDGRFDLATPVLESIEKSLRLFELFAALTLTLGNRTDSNAAAARTQIQAGRAKLVGGDNGEPDLPGANKSYQQATVHAVADQADQRLGHLNLEVRDVRAEPSTPARQEVRARRREGADWQGRWLNALLVLRWVISGALVVLALVAGMLTLYVAPEGGFIGNTVADGATLLLWGLGSGWIDKVFFDWG